MFVLLSSLKQQVCLAYAYVNSDDQIFMKLSIIITILVSYLASRIILENLFVSHQ